MGPERAGVLCADVEAAVDGHGVDGDELDVRRAAPQRDGEGRLARRRRSDDRKIGRQADGDAIGRQADGDVGGRPAVGTVEPVVRGRRMRLEHVVRAL